MRSDEKWLKKVLKKRCMIFLRQYFVTEAQQRENSGSDFCNRNAHNAREKHMHTHKHKLILFLFISYCGPSIDSPS